MSCIPDRQGRRLYVRDRRSQAGSCSPNRRIREARPLPARIASSPSGEVIDLARSLCSARGAVTAHRRSEECHRAAAPNMGVTGGRFVEIDVVLNATARAAASVRRSELRLDQAVAEARAAGATWMQIGAATGMSRQAAHERWGHIPRPGGCRRPDCDCPEHQTHDCLCGHGPGRGYRAQRSPAL